MKKFSGIRSLLVAEIDPDVLQTLEQNIPNRWRSVVTWSARTKPTNKDKADLSATINQPTLAEFTSEIAEEEDIDGVGFSIYESPGILESELSFQLWCDRDGCSLEWESPEEHFDELSRFAQTVAALLLEKKHRRWLIPLNIKLGKRPLPWWQRWNWNWRGIAERLVTGSLIGIGLLIVRSVFFSEP